MAKISMKMTNTTTRGDVVTTTINYVNPEASNATLLTFAKKVNSLTSSTYVSSDKIVTTNLDTEAGGGSKTEPSLTATDFTSSPTFGKNYYSSTLTYNGDGILFAETDSDDPENESFAYIYKYYDENKNEITYYALVCTASSVAVKIGATEGTNYAAKLITANVTVS